MFRLLILTALTSGLQAQSTALTATTAMTIKALDFEVFGRVQGVFFRKYTKEQAEKLNLRGWCKNTPQGTVQGHVQGPADKIEAISTVPMVSLWVRPYSGRSMAMVQVGEEGEGALVEEYWRSPSSKIEKAEFRNQKEISEYTYENFGIVKD